MLPLGKQIIITAFDSECVKFQTMGDYGLSQEGIAEGSQKIYFLNPEFYIFEIYK